MEIVIALLLIGITELMLLRATNDSRKDEEQNEYIKNWNKKKRSAENGNKKSS